MKNKKIDIRDRLIAKNDSWKEEHPMASWSGPWSYISLKGPEDKNKSGERWLNPENQEYVPSGYYTDEELEAWLNGDDGFLKKGKTFEELKEYCEIGHLCGWYMQKDLQMLGHPSKYLNCFSGKALKNQLNVYLLNEQYYSPKKKFNKQLIQELDGHVKAIIEDYFSYIDVETLIKNHFTINRDYQDRIYYFLQGLSHVGIGYWRYANTPPERENFSYYKDFLIHEVLKDIYTMRRIRKYKEFHIDIYKKSEFLMTSTIVWKGHTFPFQLEQESTNANILTFDQAFAECKKIIDNKKNVKAFKSFKKEPLCFSFKVIKESLK